MTTVQRTAWQAACTARGAQCIWSWGKNPPHGRQPWGKPRRAKESSDLSIVIPTGVDSQKDPIWTLRRSPDIPPTYPHLCRVQQPCKWSITYSAFSYQESEPLLYSCGSSWETLKWKRSREVSEPSRGFTASYSGTLWLREPVECSLLDR